MSIVERRTQSNPFLRLSMTSISFISLLPQGPKCAARDGCRQSWAILVCSNKMSQWLKPDSIMTLSMTPYIEQWSVYIETKGQGFEKSVFWRWCCVIPYANRCRFFERRKRLLQENSVATGSVFASRGCLGEYPEEAIKNNNHNFAINTWY